MPTRNDLRQNDDINRIANALDRIVTLLEPFAATPENTPPDPAASAYNTNPHAPSLDDFNQQMADSTFDAALFEAMSDEALTAVIQLARSVLNQRGTTTTVDQRTYPRP